MEYINLFQQNNGMNQMNSIPMNINQNDMNQMMNIYYNQNNNLNQNFQIKNNMFNFNQMNNSNMNMKMINNLKSNNNNSLNKYYQNDEYDYLYPENFHKKMSKDIVHKIKNNFQNSDFSKGKKKLILNHNNLIKKEFYFDLNSNIDELIKYIYYNLNDKYPNPIKVYKRKKKSETNKYIIEKATNEYERYDFDFENYLFLEYKKINLKILESKTCQQIGMKEGDEIALKIKNEFFLNKKNEDFSKVINVIFNYESGGILGNIFSYNYEYISTIFKRFLWKNNLNSNQIGFIATSSKYTIFSKIPLYKLNTYSLIGFKVVNVFGLMGYGFPFGFVDVSNGKVKSLEFSENALKWRKVNRGLNIFGICKNKNCEANGKEVVYNTEILKDKLHFILNEEIANIRCPLCKKIFKPKTCGFWKCEYQFSGKKINDGEVEYYDSKPKETKGDEFEYFDPFGNKEVQWIELNIYVLPKQSVKYQEN